MTRSRSRCSCSGWQRAPGLTRGCGIARAGRVAGLAVAELSPSAEWWPAATSDDRDGGGEIVALVGESGCGRTTLARTLLGLERPTSGQISYDGTPLSYSGRRLRAFRRQVQLVLQDPMGSLNPQQTVYEAVADGPCIHALPDEESVVASALSRAGLRPPERFFLRYPHELSGDRVAVMYLGRIVESGPTEDVLTNPQHPYSQALFSVLPESPERIVLTGESPDPTRIPAGCRFHPRCQVVSSGLATEAGAETACTTEPLAIMPDSTAAQVACHLAGKR